MTTHLNHSRTSTTDVLIPESMLNIWKDGSIFTRLSNYTSSMVNNSSGTLCKSWTNCKDFWNYQILLITPNGCDMTHAKDSFVRLSTILKTNVWENQRDDNTLRWTNEVQNICNGKQLLSFYKNETHFMLNFLISDSICPTTQRL